MRYCVKESKVDSNGKVKLLKLHQWLCLRVYKRVEYNDHKRIERNGIEWNVFK